MPAIVASTSTDCSGNELNLRSQSAWNSARTEQEGDVQCRYHFSLLVAHSRHHGQMPSPPSPAQPGFRDKRSRPGGGWAQSGSHGCTGTRGPAVRGQPRGLPLSCVWGPVWKLRPASFARCPLASRTDVTVGGRTALALVRCGDDLAVVGVRCALFPVLHSHGSRAWAACPSSTWDPGATWAWSALHRGH